jgi:tetratricopeptide (TPR) repeat protein
VTAPPLPRAPRRQTRTAELVLAHAHLRLGSLALARVELETMAGLGLLDTRGLVDLAEVRWRTGDLLGAGEAATAALRDDEDLPIALLVAAEAAAALGRPTEARRLATRAMSIVPDAIDAIFAGMPRSGVWPADAAEPPPTAPTMFDREPDQPSRAGRGEPAGHDRQATERIRVASAAAPVALGFWDGEADIESVSAPLPDPAMELEAGRNALVAGALEEAAFRFGLALRLAPALAPAILEATDGARGASLTVVRGDAYRVVGHEKEARQAYATAAQGGLPERRTRSRTVADPPETLTETESVVPETEADGGPPAETEDGPAG